MNTSMCKEFVQAKIGTITAAFTSGITDKTDKVLSCLYTCLKKTFVAWSIIAYRRYPSDLIEHIADNSFTDCVLKFKDAAAGRRLYHGEASVKTVLFAFYKNTLRENLQKEKRLSAKYRRIHVESAVPVDISDDNNIEHLYLSLEQALNQMTEEDRQIILWRHLDEKTNAEIAHLLGITVPSATNRIYRCMERLKNLIQKSNN